MSFIDMAFLKKTDIRGNHIYYYRRKTKQLISVWISQPMRDIINDFMSITRPDSPYVFPIIDPDEDDDEMQQYETALRLQNRRLKKLGEEAGIEKKLTTHAARHSWATVARRENISVSVISNCLGHKNETVTGVYLGAVDTGVKDEAIQHVSSLFPMNYRIYGEEETGHKKSPSPDKRRTLWNSESTAKVESIAKMKNYSGR
jgi:integrase